MQVETVVVPVAGDASFLMNCYLLSDETEPGHLLVVDPGDQAQAILAAIGERQVEGIILTHGHFDHIGAVQRVVEATGAEVMAHTDEVRFREELAALGNGSPGNQSFGRQRPMPAVQRLLTDGDLVAVGQLSLEVVHTPGHSPGSICLYDRLSGQLISGDTLFFGSMGRTDFPGGSMASMRNSLARLAQLPDDVSVYPGHDRPTSIRQEKQSGYLCG
ncbi:MAG: MBL fold metallo-hydrolase [Coriobacteriales bacterium]|jgi:glyoxylase-like metal-dependent hydrolase (beta-lactamase superfamily II)|nr:MBL fold metallo-hydrolase [Coriobacteriales bacterium]